MKNKKLFSGLLALTLVCTSITPVFAADINVSGGNSSVPVELKTEAATFSVTVPTALPVEVDADGVVTTAPDVAIVNNSHGAVKVTNMTISGVGDWEIVDWDSADMTSEKVGAKKLAMTINGDKTTADDTISFTEVNFPKMDGKNDSDSDELEIVYNAKVPAQATALNSNNIANVVFTIGWDEKIMLTGGLYDANDVKLYSWEELIENGILRMDGTTVSSDNYFGFNTTETNTKFVVSEDVTAMKEVYFCADYNVTKVKTIIIPDNVETLKYGAISMLQRMDGDYAHIYLPDNITVETYAFNNCNNCVIHYRGNKYVITNYDGSEVDAVFPDSTMFT